VFIAMLSPNLSCGKRTEACFDDCSKEYAGDRRRAAIDPPSDFLKPVPLGTVDSIWIRDTIARLPIIVDCCIGPMIPAACWKAKAAVGTAATATSNESAGRCPIFGWRRPRLQGRAVESRNGLFLQVILTKKDIKLCTCFWLYFRSNYAHPLGPWNTCRNRPSVSSHPAQRTPPPATALKELESMQRYGFAGLCFSTSERKANIR
jgi:hypothetical protein